MTITFTNRVYEFRFELAKRMITNIDEEVRLLAGETAGVFPQGHIKSYWPFIFYLLLRLRYKHDDKSGKIMRVTDKWLEHQLAFDLTKKYEKSSFAEALASNYYDVTKGTLESVGLFDFVVFKNSLIYLNPMIAVHTMVIGGEDVMR